MKIQKTLNTSVWQHKRFRLRRLDCASVCDVDMIVCLCSCGQSVCVSDNNNNINWEERDIQLYQQKKSSLHLHRNRRVINKINNVNSNNIYNSKHKTNMTERERERLKWMKDLWAEYCRYNNVLRILDEQLEIIQQQISHQTSAWNVCFAFLIQFHLSLIKWFVFHNIS